MVGENRVQGRPADWPCSDAHYLLEVEVGVIIAERWPALHINARAGGFRASPNPKLVDLIKTARGAQILVDERRDLSIEELAKQQGCRPTHFARPKRLKYLAPNIATAILNHTQPTDFDRNKLLASIVPTC